MTLVIERFDRRRRAGMLGRVHQEDFCQALGIDPGDKYAHPSAPKGTDPTYAKVERLLLAYSAEPVDELAELLCQLSINMALGNSDAHGKSYSLTYEIVGVPRLSPLYDVVPVVDNEPAARLLSMRINGKISLEDIARDDVVREAASWGLDTDLATSVLDEALEKVRCGLDAAAGLYPKAAERHGPQALERLGCLCVHSL